MMCRPDSALHIADHLEFYVRVHNDADSKGLKRGNGGHSTCICPCCLGTAAYRVTGSNGHIWAKCETDGCGGFIE